MTTTQIPIDYEIDPYLFDHRHGSQAVLPAVEALQLLASSARTAHPDLTPLHQCRAQFHKFLFLDHLIDGTVLQIFSNVDIADHGHIICQLMTKNRVGRTTFSRLKEHVRVEFLTEFATTEMRPANLDVQISEGYRIPVTRLYRELVPFGPSYQNLTGTVRLTPDGAAADIMAPDIHDPRWLLGSPFPLDAAFHAACAWGQRYAHIVGFPVGFDRRDIFYPTRAGKRYAAAVVPADKNNLSETLTFDIQINDVAGRLCETVGGVAMRDVSGGRNVPPQWVMAKDA